MTSNSDSSVSTNTKKEIFRLEFNSSDFDLYDLEELSHFLTQFGKIDYINKCNRCWSGYVIYNGEHTVPRKLPHSVGIHIFAVDRLCEPKRLQLTSMKTTISKLTFEKLNDDCMYEILKYLNIIDICHLKELCGHFDGVFDNVLRKRLKTKEFNLRKEVESHSGCSILTILENAGKYIKRAIINVRTLTSSFLKLILSKCLNVEHLSLEDIDITNYSLSEEQMVVFSNLYSLYLSNVEGSENDFTNFMNTLNARIKRFSVKKCFGFYGHHLANFTLLELLEIDHFESVKITDIKKCLTVNSKTMKKFYHTFLFVDGYYSIYDCNLFRSLSNLEICHLSSSNYIGMPKIELHHFENLKELNLNFNRFEFYYNLEICQIFDTLESLHIICREPNTSFCLIQRFHNLKKLSIMYQCYPENFLKVFIGKFRYLEHFAIGVDDRINRNELMEFIKSMENLKLLNFNTIFGRICCRNFINEYKQWRDHHKPDMKLFFDQLEIV